jgi:hypothetical protein
VLIHFRLTLPINCTRWSWKYRRYVSSKFWITWLHVRGGGWFQLFHSKLTVRSNAAVPWLLSANSSHLLQLCATLQSLAITYSFLRKGTLDIFALSNWQTHSKHNEAVHWHEVVLCSKCFAFLLVYILVHVLPARWWQVIICGFENNVT